MSDRTAFLQAVCTAPDDDLARLVFADWLDDHDCVEESPCPCAEYVGDPDNPWRGTPGFRPERSPASGRHEGGWTNCQACKGAGVVRRSNGFAARAEFIRVQCELATTRPFSLCGVYAVNMRPGESCGRCGDCLRRPLLREREWKLLAEPRNFVNWTPSVMHTGIMAGIRLVTGGTVGLFGKGFREATFSRGFISQVTCTAADWLTHWRAIAWRPGWKVTCEHCRGYGRYADHSEAECTNCGGKTGTGKYGTGIVDAPLSPTCQPIERVTLTTQPDDSPEWGFLPRFRARRVENGSETCTYKSWPGIVFSLPGV